MTPTTIIDGGGEENDIKAAEEILTHLKQILFNHVVHLGEKGVRSF
jgi:hypothetical protein